MTVEHPAPTTATIKGLYADAVMCAYPDCTESLYRSDASSGRKILNSRIAHIAARREGGPRWDAAMTPEENRAGNNLILLCIRHAAEIDDPVKVQDFPSAFLQQWKQRQLEGPSTTGTGLKLSDEQVAEVGARSFDWSPIELTAGSIVLGGQGGQAPGAGGGGGGAIGHGGGAGHGGQGGQVVSRSFNASDLPDAVAITIGRGGRESEPGQPGEDGGATWFGDLLEAAGGKGGSGAAFIQDKPIGPRGPREPARRDDLDPTPPSAIRVTTLMLVDELHFREGVAFVLSGGWTHVDLVGLPGEMQCRLLLAIDVQPGYVGRDQSLQVDLVSPAGLRIPQWSSSILLDGDVSPSSASNVEHSNSGLLEGGRALDGEPSSERHRSRRASF